MTPAGHDAYEASCSCKFWSKELPIRFLLALTLLSASGTLYAQTPTLAGCTIFPANNIWNTRVDNLPVDSNSATYVNTMGTSNPLHPDFGAGGGIPYTLVPGSQPKVNVTFRYWSDAGPYPIPSNVAIEGGANASGDRHALIIDTTNCVLYELFSLYHQANGTWEAGSGAIFPLNSNALRPNGWTSADAAGLPILPGLIRYDEMISGHIDHAIRFTAQQTRNTYIWPARHEASALTGSQYPQMGQRFRLKQDFDISSFAPHVQVVLQALKTYGMIVADNGTSWHVAGVGDPRFDDNEMHQLTRVVGADFEAVNEAGLMVNPNSAEAKSGSTTGPPPPVPPTGGLPTGWVNLISKNSGKCLDVTGGPSATESGVSLQQWTCVGGTNQEFELMPVTGGYKMTARHSSLQVEIRGGPTAKVNGTLIEQGHYAGLSSQIWTVKQTSEGYYSISSISSGACLDVRAVSKLNGAPIQQWSCSGGANQQWSFDPAN